MSSAIIIAGIGTAVGIASAISSGNQQKKAIQNQNDIAMTQLQNQKLLDEATLRANNVNTKNKIIADSLVAIRSNQQNALIQYTLQAQQMSKDAEKRNLVYLAIGGGVILVGSIAVLKIA